VVTGAVTQATSYALTSMPMMDAPAAELAACATTRVDPFSDVWTEIEHWLEAQPERTAKSVFLELQQRYPGQFPHVQLPTLQRRVAC